MNDTELWKKYHGFRSYCTDGMPFLFTLNAVPIWALSSAFSKISGVTEIHAPGEISSPHSR